MINKLDFLNEKNCWTILFASYPFVIYLSELMSLMYKLPTRANNEITTKQTSY